MERTQERFEVGTKVLTPGNRYGWVTEFVGIEMLGFERPCAVVQYAGWLDDSAPANRFDVFTLAQLCAVDCNSAAGNTAV